jgi:phosphomannomutase/phosphoglucomutase
LSTQQATLLWSLPYALKVRLLEPDNIAVDDTPVAPLGYAALEMLRSAAANKQPPPVEAHLFGTRRAAVNRAQPVMDDGGKLVGLILVSYDVAMLQELLSTVPAHGLYMELLQAMGDDEPTLVLERGDRSLRKGAPSARLPVAGTRWQLAFWFSDTAAGLGLGGTLAAAMGVSFVLLLLLVLGLQWIIGRWLSSDLESITRLVWDLRNGRAQEGAYPVRLAPCAAAVQALSQLSPASGPVRELPEAGPASAATPGGFGGGGVPAPSVLVADEDALDIAIVDEGFEVPASIFRAYDIRGVVGETLTEDLAYLIGRAIGSEAEARGQGRLVVGRDGRESGIALFSALTRGLVETGREVIDVGQVPTPLLYFAAEHLGTGSGVMITGSHNPAQYNGMKIVLAQQTLSGEAIQALRTRMESGSFVSGQGSMRQEDVVAAYIERVTCDVGVARPFKVVVDAGNGVAGPVIVPLLEELGCEVIPLYCDVDGSFPNHHPDPSQPENLSDLIQRVGAEQAELGLAFDGDGDRLGVVDGAGHIIWPDRQMMLFAMDVLSRHPGADIIYDVKCTRHLGRVIAEHGGRPLMWKTGYSMIKAKMRETGALLGGELSGHICFKERWYGFDDALYGAARLLEILGMHPSECADVFASLPDSINTPELHIDLQEGENIALMARLAENPIFEGGEVNDLDGLRVEFPDGWGLVRASNTTPSLVMRFEADNEAALKRIQEVFRARLRALNPKLTIPF